MIPFLKSNAFLKNVVRLLSGCRLQHNVAAKKAAVYKSGQLLYGYRVQNVVPIPELSIVAIQLVHEKTGALHLHLDSEDSDNVFGVAFRTTPLDSTGVSHILEHTALCGSKKYPVRDPFFKMLTRSLNTFMNAFTASDWTMYPFSTQNSRDYENLLSVYLDSAFNPQLRESDFRQEGWRLEHEDVNNPESPLIFKGIVFNEMKGVFSSPHQVFAQAAQNLLMPHHTYSTVYGGDPIRILDLTHEGLRSFHSANYHPSNSRFYTYGNFPLERHLELINDLALSHFERTRVDTAVPYQPRWTRPKQERITCNPDHMAADPNKQTTIAVSYLLGDITNTFEAAVLSILGTLLIDGESSPFYRSLIDSNIGSDFAPVLGYDGNTKESSFTVGLQGIDAKDVEKVKALIEDTLDRVIREGFEAERIEAILHKIELSLKHRSTKFGLHLGLSVLQMWNHDGDPIEGLKVNQLVDRFKLALRDNPNLLKEKVNQYLKKNPHRLTLIMSADEKYEEKRKALEEKKLASVVSSLSEADKKALFKSGLELSEQQNREEDLSCLPTLKVEDIEPRFPLVLTDTRSLDGIKVQLCAQATNDVTYFRAFSDVHDLSEELKPYLPLFCNVITKMGAGDMDYRDLSHQIDLRTGGLDASTVISDHPAQPATFQHGVLFSSYSLDKNADRMFQLWTEIFCRPSFSDLNRLVTLIRMSAAELANSVANSGHNYAITHSASGLNAAARAREVTSGMTHVQLMKRVAEMDENGLEQIRKKLEDIASYVLTRDRIRFALNATPEFMDTSFSLAGQFANNLPRQKMGTKNTSEFYRMVDDFTSKSSNTHFEFPFQVNYVGRSVPTVPYTHPDSASLRILGRLMTTRYLHREIREKGGAYGGGATGDRIGFYSFYSYRDPNLVKTLEAFSRSVTWAVEGKFTAQDVDEAKLSVFSQVDMPVPPSERGMRQFVHGIDEEMRQRHRESLFSANKNDIVRVAESYLVAGKKLSSTTFLGPQNSITESDPGMWEVVRET